MDKYLKLINEINTLIEKYHKKLEREQAKLEDYESQTKQIETDLEKILLDIEETEKEIKNYKGWEYVFTHPIKSNDVNLVLLLLFVIVPLTILLIYAGYEFSILSITIPVSIISSGALMILLVINNYRTAKKYLESHSIEELPTNLSKAKDKKFKRIREKKQMSYDIINCKIVIYELQKMISREETKLEKVKDQRRNAIDKLLTERLEPKLNALFDESDEMRLLLNKKEGGR